MRNKAHHQISLAVVARVAQAESKSWKDWIRDMENTTKVGGTTPSADTAGQKQFENAVKLGLV